MFSSCESISLVQFLDLCGLTSLTLKEAILSASSLDSFLSFLHHIKISQRHYLNLKPQCWHNTGRQNKHMSTQHSRQCSYLRQLAKCLMVRWRLVMPKDWAWSIAVVMGSCCPVVKARRAHRTVEMVGDGKWLRASQAERSSDCTSSRERFSKEKIKKTNNWDTWLKMRNSLGDTGLIIHQMLFSGLMIMMIHA